MFLFKVLLNTRSNFYHLTCGYPKLGTIFFVLANIISTNILPRYKECQCMPLCYHLLVPLANNVGEGCLIFTDHYDSHPRQMYVNAWSCLLTMLARGDHEKETVGLIFSSGASVSGCKCWHSCSIRLEAFFSSSLRFACFTSAMNSKFKWHVYIHQCPFTSSL